MSSKRRGRRLRKNTAKKLLSKPQEAGRILAAVAAGYVDKEHPDAVWAAEFLSKRTIDKITGPHIDCLSLTVPGSFESKRR